MSDRGTAGPVGIDFGTTNSAVAWTDPDGRLHAARFGTACHATYRSILYFEPTADRRRVASVSSGPEALDRYVASDARGRLIQSLKSYLADRHFSGTTVGNRRWSLEDLIGRLLTNLRVDISRQCGRDVRCATVGRPVRFVDARSDEDDEAALARLRTAFAAAGFDQVAFVPEPVAAAHHFSRAVTRRERILLGDFGGGTSDFSIVDIRPATNGGAPALTVLANSGVGVAGDAFDGKIVRHLVATELGAGTMMREGDRPLPVPQWPYTYLERWHHVSLIRTAKTLDMLEGIRRKAEAPERIDRLIGVVDEDLGYDLHAAVQQVKNALSTQDHATFEFGGGSAAIRRNVARTEFEAWIADDLDALGACIDDVCRASGVATTDVTSVFLTGGTSYVPAVVRLFGDRFPGVPISRGDAFTSVAAGLALAGRDA